MNTISERVKSECAITDTARTPQPLSNIHVIQYNTFSSNTVIKKKIIYTENKNSFSPEHTHTPNND